MYRMVQCTGWYNGYGTKGVVLRAWYNVQDGTVAWYSGVALVLRVQRVTQTHEQRHWEVASVLVLN